MAHNKQKILIGPSTFGALDRSPVSKLQEHGFEVIDNPYKRKYSKQELIDLLPGVTGLIAGLETLDREVMAGSQLKVISRCGAGMSNVDLKAAEELGILVRNTPEAPAIAVSELTLGCLLALLRQVVKMNGSLHEKKWNKVIGRQLKDMQVTVVGYGNIGKKVARLLTAFGARVAAVDPRFSVMVEGIPVITLAQALKRSDAITLHCSGDKCLLGADEFSVMKKGVFILNAARGGLIDEKALKDALDSGLVAGAWLDTFENEPYAGVLCDHPQVILTPHAGSYSLECRLAMETEAVDNLIGLFAKIK